MDIWKHAILENRFRFVADLNGDGVFTVSDVGAWFNWVYFAPGDSIAILLLNSGLGNFLEISTDSINGLGSGVFSFFAWWMLFAVLANAQSATRAIGSKARSHIIRGQVRHSIIRGALGFLLGRKR